MTSNLPGFGSTVLQLYIEALGGKSQEPHVLDVGPICTENIMFFAQQVKKIYVCDMFMRVNRSRRKGRSSAESFVHLDYPKHVFDGIHLWDLIDHLDDQDASRLVGLCHEMLKPGGLMTVFAFEEAAERPLIRSFVILDRYLMTFRPQTHLDLPWHFRTNRELISLFSVFPRISSFLSRSGARELLLERS